MMTSSPAPQTQPIVRAGAHSYELARRRLRRPQELLDAVANIDVTVDPQAQEQLLDWIRQYYHESQGGQLIGFFARCYLGHPYIDHRVALTGGIAEHFTAMDLLPTEFQACRALVRSSAYIFIEVYSDGQVVPIRTDGMPAL